MKKGFLFIALLASVGFTSCKKKGCIDATAVNYSESAKKDDGSCLYKPLITLNGSSSVTIFVGDTYSDAGATAKNKDGSSVIVTTDASDVDATTVGVYTVTYSASNANGTTTATRTVNVVIGQDNWAGNWVLTHDCTTSFPLNSTPTVSVGGASDAITIDGMFSISIPAIPIVLPDGLTIAEDGTANATVNGSQITISSQVYDVLGVGSITYSGTGSMNSIGTQFTVNYTYTNSLPGIGGSGNCVATYTKQ